MDVSEQEVLGPEFLADLPGRALPVLRGHRSSCQQLGDALSYVRRLAQGRLDIVEAERARRAAGGDPGDLAALVDALPTALAAHAGPSRPGAPRPRVEDAGGDAALAVLAPLDAIVDEGGLLRLPERSDDELAALAERLRGFESDVSARRRDVFAVLDSLSAELTRRYRDGEASVDGLLQPGGG